MPTAISVGKRFETDGAPTGDAITSFSVSLKASCVSTAIRSSSRRTFWFYQGQAGSGTPAFFYLLFFKRNDFGEYRLYSPMADGPQALLNSSENLPGAGNERAAYQRIREVAGELAQASLSFDPSEPGDAQRGRASLGSQVMMARIEESPRRAIRTDYADAWMRYGNRVSAEYSFNYVPSRSVFSVLADPSGIALVHFSVSSGDGRNPSPLGEEKIVVLWSRVVTTGTERTRKRT